MARPPATKASTGATSAGMMTLPSSPEAMIASGPWALASRAAIARLGAKEEGITRNHVRHRDGTLRDTVNFSILDTEWACVKRNLIARLEQYA